MQHSDPKRKPASSATTLDALVIAATAAKFLHRRAAVLAVHLSYVDPQQYAIALREIKENEANREAAA